MEKEEIEEEQKKTNLFGIFRKIPIMAIIFPPIGIMMLIKFSPRSSRRTRRITYNYLRALRALRALRGGKL